MVLINQLNKKGNFSKLVSIILATIIFFLIISIFDTTLNEPSSRLFANACNTLLSKVPGFSYACEKFYKDKVVSDEEQIQIEKDKLACYNRFNQMLRDLKNNPSPLMIFDNVDAQGEIILSQKQADKLFTNKIDQIRKYSEEKIEGKDAQIYFTSFEDKSIYFFKYLDSEELWAFMSPSYCNLGLNHMNYEDYEICSSLGENKIRKDMKMEDKILAKVYIEGRDCRSWGGSRLFGVDYRVETNKNEYGRCEYDIKEIFSNAREIIQTPYEIKTGDCQHEI